MVSIGPVVRDPGRGATVGSACAHYHLPLGSDQTRDGAPLRRRARALPRDPPRRGNRVPSAAVTFAQPRRQGALRAAGSLPTAARNASPPPQPLHFPPPASPDPPPHP